MEKIGIFTSDQKDWHVKQLGNEIEKKGFQYVSLPIDELVAKISQGPRVLCKGYDLEKLRGFIVRWTPKGSAEQIIFRMDTLHRLENLGVKVFNPASSIEKCADKFYTCSLLEDAGIPVPKTVVAEKYEDAMKAFRELKDVVVKPLFGSLGAGILRIHDRDIAYRVFKALEFGRSVYYIQEFIPHGNQDVRAFVLGDEVIASMKRIGKDWKTNFSKGAQVQAYDLSDEFKRICVKASKTVGCEHAGVDLIDQEGPVVTEVNSIPGWKGLQSVARVNVAEKIVDYFLNWKGP